MTSDQCSPSVTITNNNSIQFFIINVLNQQLQRQLQTQHSVDIGNKIKSKATE
jgi:hypothetical protein